MMEEKEIIEKLKELRKIKPTADWQEKSRAFLLAKIQQIPQKEPLPQFSFSYKLAGVFSLLILIFSTFLMTAASASLKSPLYPVRSILEKTLIALAPEETKIELKLILAEKKIKELNELVNNQGSALAFRDFDQNLKDLSLDLKKVSHPQELLFLTEKIQREIGKTEIKRKELVEPLNEFTSQVFALQKEAEEKINQCPVYLSQRLIELEKAINNLVLEEKKAEEIAQQLEEAKLYLENSRCIDALVILDKIAQELGL